MNKSWFTAFVWSTGKVGACGSMPSADYKPLYNDLISGKVNEVDYQPGAVDQFYHRYEYDAENRITDVYTTDNKAFVGNKNLEEHEAFYEYYKHGPLARAVIGQQEVQGIDYAYTLEGWLKGVNSNTLQAAAGTGVLTDMGGDGVAGSPNQFVGQDAYGFSLNYFTGEYAPINAGLSPFPGFSGLMPSGYYNPLYNGNISAMSVNIGKLNAPLLYNYQYDQLNRIVAMDAFTGLNQVSNTFSPLTTDGSYQERLSYDANGNIKSYLRNGTGATMKLNNYQYSYQNNTNKLTSIQNNVNNQASNYAYDAIGNVIKDDNQNVAANDWNVYGKLQTTQKTDGTNITYTYDAAGNRISKTASGTNGYAEWYVRDASGNIMSGYNLTGTSITQTEQHLYGNSRLGIFNRNINADEQLPVGINANLIGKYFLSSFTRGNKQYEFSDHRGSLLLTTSDKKIPYSSNGTTVDHYCADVISATDYSTFGAVSRSFNASLATNAFDGQRRSPEISATAQTAQFWEYNGDVGRRWNLEPKPTFGISEYSTFFNNPITHIDIIGDTPTVKEAALMADDSYRKFSERNKELKEKYGWNRVEKVKSNLFGKSNQEVSLDDLGSHTGYNMALYSRTVNGKTEWVLANAGTADLVDIGSDIGQTQGGSAQYAFSIRFAKSLQNGMGGQEMTYVGHSLGGGLAAANSLATGNAAITFNPQGVSWGTRMINNLPKDKRDGQIRSFVVAGEVVDRSQRLIGSSANGQVTYISPQYGIINKGTAIRLQFFTNIITSLEYHRISTVLQSLDKAGIK